MDEANQFTKYGFLKDKSNSRSVCWILPNFINVCNDLKNVRSDLFMVSTLPNSIYFLAISLGTDIFTIHITRCGDRKTTRQRDNCSNAVIFLEDSSKDYHFIKKFTLETDEKSFSFACDHRRVLNILSESKLQIHCTITEENHFIHSSVKDWRNHRGRDCSTFPLNELKNHIKVLLDGDEQNKIVLEVDGEAFPVHKTLLCSHSPVFSAMFNHDTVENQHNRILIVDINKEVVLEILKYIYTGCTSELSPPMSIELYIAADKYGIHNLKEKCTRSLISSLNSDSVLDILVLSHTHADDNLKKSAVQFLIEKAPELVESKDFVLFIKNESEVVQSILLALIKQIII